MTFHFWLERIQFNIEIEGLRNERGHADTVLIAYCFEGSFLCGCEFDLCANRFGFVFCGLVIMDDLVMDVFAKYEFALFHGAPLQQLVDDDPRVTEFVRVEPLQTGNPCNGFQLSGQILGDTIPLGFVKRVHVVVGSEPLVDKIFEFLHNNNKPTLYIAGTRDEFCSQENLRQLTRRLPASSSVHQIEGAEHFFNGYIETIQSLITDFFRAVKLGLNTP